MSDLIQPIELTGGQVPPINSPFKITKQQPSEASLRIEERLKEGSSAEYPKFFTTRDLLLFFQRLAGEGVLTFDQLKNYRATNPQDKLILDFLIRQNGFYLIARLTGASNQIDPNDIKLAASLSGNPFELSIQDLQLLEATEQSKAQKPSTTNALSPDGSLKPESAEQTLLNAEGEPRFSIRELSSFLKTFSPTGEVPLQTLQDYLPKDEREAGMKTYLTHPAILHTMETHGLDPSKLSPDVLSWLMLMFAHPTNFMNGRVIFQSIEAQKQLKAEGIEFFDIEQHGDQMSGVVEKTVRFSPEEIITFLNTLSDTGTVSLAHLNAYHPETEREQLLKSHLRLIFNRLAKLDGEGFSISPEDIHLAEKLACDAHLDHFFFTQTLLNYYHFA